MDDRMNQLGWRKMKDGRIVELLAHRYGRLWGIIHNGDMGHVSSSWAENTGGGGYKEYDLVLPEPPLVISDEAVEAFSAAWRSAQAQGLVGECARRAGLVAAYPIIRRENGHE